MAADGRRREAIPIAEGEQFPARDGCYVPESEVIPELAVVSLVRLNSISRAAQRRVQWTRCSALTRLLTVDVIPSANERRERLIVTSRQITALSKKLIFQLHRGAVGTDADGRRRLVAEGKKKERVIYALFEDVRDELGGAATGTEAESFWRYARQVSPGLEEYIEALAFLHFIEFDSLITLQEVQTHLSDTQSGEALLYVTSEDYILGISDLTGELMRYATNAIGTGDHQTPLRICSMVREIKAVFDIIPPYILRKLEQKQAETQRSLEKIEKVCYALRLRLIEFADRPDILAQMAQRALDDADAHVEQRPIAPPATRDE